MRWTRAVASTRMAHARLRHSSRRRSNLHEYEQRDADYERDRAACDRPAINAAAVEALVTNITERKSASTEERSRDDFEDAARLHRRGVAHACYHRARSRRQAQRSARVSDHTERTMRRESDSDILFWPLTESDVVSTHCRNCDIARYLCASTHAPQSARMPA